MLDFFALEKARCTSNDVFFEIYRDLALDCLVRKPTYMPLERRHHAWATVVEALLAATYLDARDYFRSEETAMEVLTWLMRELAIYPRVDTIPFTVLQDTKLEENLRKCKKYKHASDEFRANFRVLKSGPLKITEFPAFEDLDFTHVDQTRQGEYQWSVQPLRYVKGWRFALARRLCKVRRAKKSKRRTSSKMSVAEIGDIQSESVAALPTSPEPIASIEKTSDRGHISPSTSEQAGDSDLVSLSTRENTTSPTMPPTSPAVDKAFDKENASPLSHEDGESSRLEEETSFREAPVTSNHEAGCACPTVRSGWICITCPGHPV